MTIDEIRTAERDALEERAAEIVAEVETADAETLDALDAELDAINTRKAELTEEKRHAMLDVTGGAGDIIAETETETEEERETMDNYEIRKSPEYLNAWIMNEKGAATAEQRALLTENATNGTIAVPVYIEEGIRTAWESNDFLRLVRRTYYPGNLKVGYEVSASAAANHTEGGQAVTEEELVIGTVALIPGMIKKWVSYSDEAGDMRPDFGQYIVDELTDKIIKGVITNGVNAMANSTLTQTLRGQEQLTIGEIIQAEGMLAGDAAPVIVTTRQNAAMLKLSALEASFAVNPFDGLDVVYVNALPEHVLAFVADLSAVHANFPNGDDVRIKFDDLTDAASDMVKVYGRLYAAIDVVAPGKVVSVIDNK